MCCARWNLNPEISFPLNYFNQKYLLGDDWGEAKNALVENIKRYKNEWEIKEINHNRDGKEYFHQETNRQVSKLTVLVHQSAPEKRSINGFLIVEQPRMYLKSYFSAELWAEIEKSLTEQSTQPARFPLKTVLGIIGVLLVVGVILVLFYWKKKAKK